MLHKGSKLVESNRYPDYSRDISLSKLEDSDERYDGGSLKAPVIPQVVKANSEVKKENSIKEIARVWCEDTTWHGFKNVVKNDSWIMKILWIAVLIGSTGFCVYSESITRSQQY